MEGIMTYSGCTTIVAKGLCHTIHEAMDQMNLEGATRGEQMEEWMGHVEETLDVLEWRLQVDLGIVTYISSHDLLAVPQQKSAYQIKKK